MIYVLCLNPAFDRMLVMDHLELDEVNRVEKVHEVVAGKGVNVARAIRSVGGSSKLLLFLGGFIGKKIEKGLQEEGLEFMSWEAIGETRITTVIHERGEKRHTVLNEPGPLVSLSQAVKLYQFLENHIQDSDYLILSGSLPVGLRMDFYAQIVALGHHKRAKTVVDSSGEFLRRALKISPFMVKPNIREAEEALGFSIQNFEDKLQAVAMFLAQGIELVVLSDGPRGLLVGFKEKLWKVSLTREVQGEYFIGSGDTLVGVLIEELDRGRTMEEAISFATACGLANTLCPGAGV
ncbi:MAG: 1-phosphofructokinase family hexose kinase, partial [Atribacterota bacterium]|nr:1-phosphofructokinase family hexose kinase [Atribacterota bacterium]